MTDHEIVALWRQHKEVMGFAHALLVAERERLAQPEQEPVAWVDEGAIRWLADRKGKTSAHCTTQLSAARSFEQSMPIYTAPPQPEQGQG